MSEFEPEYAWACATIEGSPRPFIHTNSVRLTRVEAQAYMADAWAREGETAKQGWKRAYRRGWRCIRVKVSAFGSAA